MVTENELKFFEFIYDRHLVWYHRYEMELNKPWTDDPILEKFKFCNVYRELDKGTIYLVKHIKDSFHILPPEILLNIVGYRFFNYVGFFEDILHFSGEPILNGSLTQFAQMVDFYDSQIAKGKSIFNNAYTVCQVPFVSDARPRDKHYQVIRILMELSKSLSEFTADLILSETPTYAIHKLQRIHSVGPFLSYELYSDLLYFDFFVKRFSENEFVNIGPGAWWGLDLLYEKKHQTDDEVMQVFIELFNKQEEAFSDLKTCSGKNWWQIARKDHELLTYRNLEHSLCEYRKYVNIKAGKGRRRLFYG